MESVSNSNNVRQLKSRFARRFLRALFRIHNLSNPSYSSSSNRETALRRCQRVKMAAYASMASAIGRRRVWSQAMLRRIRRYRSQRRPGQVSKIMRGSRKKRNKVGPEAGAEVRVVKKLRKLVSGGESMNLEGLLHETAHYVKCLAVQVQVMRSIANFYSCP